MFDGDNCISIAVDFWSKLKDEDRRVIQRIVEYNLRLRAHNVSGFDTWNILYNLTCDKQIADIIKVGKNIYSLRIFNGYIQNNENKNPQHLISRYGMTHLNYSQKKLGKTFESPKELLKTEMNHGYVYSETWRDIKSKMARLC